MKKLFLLFVVAGSFFAAGHFSGGTGWISYLAKPAQYHTGIVEGSCMNENLESLLDIRNVSSNGEEINTVKGMSLFIHSLDDNGNMSMTLAGLPKFKDYPAVKKAPDAVAESIDWTSHPDAKSFRTRLSEGLEWARKNRPELIEGKYTAVMHGCGSGCQRYWIINVETGKVLGNISTEKGVHYQPDSRLLVANMMYAVEQNDHTVPEVDEIEHRSAVGYYTIENDKLSLIKLVCTPRPWQLKSQKE